MFELRDYQRKAVDDVREAYRAGRRSPLLVAPTGAGKTVIFSHITANAAQRGNRTVILVHRAELLQQTHRALEGMGVPHGLVAAGRTPDPTHLTQVASVQTLIRRLDKFRPPDLVIVDECHHAAAGSWSRVIEAYPQARLLGVTATPQRLDGKGLSGVFDTLIRGPEVADLIREGWLCQPVYYAPSTVNMDGARTTAGDWNRADSEAIVDRPTITGDAVKHYRRICPGAPAVVFTTSLKHAAHVRDQFNAAGYNFELLDGTLDPAERARRVLSLSEGRLHGLVTVDIVSEGFDLPCISAAILLRPTQSVALHIQQIGRVLRPMPGKQRAYVLDHVGNCLRHGLAEEVREWSLEGQRRRRKKADDELVEKHRQCPACFAVHVPAPICPACQHVYEVKVRRLDEVDGELSEVDFEALRAARLKRQEQGRAQTVEQLTELGRSRGYKNPAAWARHLIAARQRR